MLTYERRLGDDRVVIALNFSHEERRWTPPADAGRLTPLASTTPGEPRPGLLAPDQGVVLAET